MQRGMRVLEASYNDVYRRAGRGGETARDMVVNGYACALFHRFVGQGQFHEGRKTKVSKQTCKRRASLYGC